MSESLALPVLPTSPTERFRCEYYRCTLTAGDCVRRQKKRIRTPAGRDRVPAHLERCASGKCAQGIAVAASCGPVAIETPDDARHRRQKAAKKRSAPLIAAVEKKHQVLEQLEEPPAAAPVEEPVSSRISDPAPAANDELLELPDPVALGELQPGPMTFHKEEANGAEAERGTDRALSPGNGGQGVLRHTGEGGDHHVDPAGGLARGQYAGRRRDGRPDGVRAAGGPQAVQPQRAVDEEGRLDALAAQGDLVQRHADAGPLELASSHVAAPRSSKAASAAGGRQRSLEGGAARQSGLLKIPPPQKKISPARRRRPRKPLDDHPALRRDLVRLARAMTRELKRMNRRRPP